MINCTDSCLSDTPTAGPAHWTGWTNIPGGANQSPQPDVGGSEVSAADWRDTKGKRKSEKDWRVGGGLR